MREKVFDDRTIRLTEEEWCELLSRFDLNKAVENSDEERFEIPTDGCHMCKKYRGNSNDCGICPLHGSDGEGDCGDLVEVVVGDWLVFYMSRSLGIHWDIDDDEEARTQVEKVHAALSRMKKVARRTK